MSQYHDHVTSNSCALGMIQDGGGYKNSNIFLNFVLVYAHTES